METDIDAQDDVIAPPADPQEHEFLAVAAQLATVYYAMTTRPEPASAETLARLRGKVLDMLDGLAAQSAVSQS